jgi:hypothetical protein
VEAIRRSARLALACCPEELLCEAGQPSTVGVQCPLLARGDAGECAEAGAKL